MTGRNGRPKQRLGDSELKPFYNLRLRRRNQEHIMFTPAYAPTGASWRDSQLTIFSNGANIQSVNVAFPSKIWL